MVLVRKWPFFNLFFLGSIGQENIFYDILEQKNAFLGYKNKTFKKSKNWYFSEGVNPWFLSKNGRFFQLFFLRQYRPGKYLYDILERKPAILESSKSRKIDIFPKGWIHGLSPKMAILKLFFLLKQYRPRKCLLRYSRTKKRLSRLWKQKVRKVEKFTFVQRFLDFFSFFPWFWSKMAIFPTFFFFGNIGKENAF